MFPHHDLDLFSVFHLLCIAFVRTLQPQKIKTIWRQMHALPKVVDCGGILMSYQRFIGVKAFLRSYWPVATLSDTEGENFTTFNVSFIWDFWVQYQFYTVPYHWRKPWRRKSNPLSLCMFRGNERKGIRGSFILHLLCLLLFLLD